MKSLIIRSVAVAAGAALAVPMFAWASPAGAVAASAAAVPKSTIKGSPAKFTPATLTATGKLPSGGKCAAKYASFEFINSEKVAEKFKLSATGLGTGSGSVPAGAGEYICIPKTFKSTVKVTLTSDKKVLSVKF
jgi:hypothetical protein